MFLLFHKYALSNIPTRLANKVGMGNNVRKALK